MTSFDKLFSVLGVTPQNLALYQEALTHPSAKKVNNYERLEFLGDAVIELISTNYIYSHFPEYLEGRMTKLRALVVSRPSLASFAQEINLGAYMTFSHSEMNNKGKTKASNLSNSFEALIAAIYLDLGYMEAERVFLQCAKPMLRAGYAEKTGGENPKGKLQELLQSIIPVAPTYELVSEVGPDHHKVFVIKVLWNGVVLAQGQGSNKKAAESDAASKAIIAKAWA